MASKTELNDLRKIQNQCIRIINKKSATSDIAGQYEKLKILKLDHLINLQLCKLGHMISHINCQSQSIECLKQKEGKNYIVIRLEEKTYPIYKHIHLKLLIKASCAEV